MIRVEEVHRGKSSKDHITYHRICEYADKEGLIPIDLIRRDHFFRHIFGYEKPHAYLRSILVVSFFVIVTFASALIEQVFINDSLAIDMLRDIGFWVIIGLVYSLTPISILIYRNTTRLFLLLFKSSIIKADKATFNRFTSRMNAGSQSIFILIFIYSAGFLIFIFQYTLMPLKTIHSWHAPGLVGSISVTSILFIPLNIYHQVLMVQFLVRTVNISIIMISFFLDNSMELDLSHHESHEVKGIELIGKFALVNFSIVFCFSIFLAASLFSTTHIYDFPLTHFYNIILIVEFYICSFASVFSPILLLI